MAITKPTARKLATQLEWTLLESSYAPLLKDITIGRLRQKITRARKYQDKYRALERQQRGEARGKRKPRGTRPSGDNERTVQKHTLFTEARERFEAQLEKLEARDARSQAKSAKKTAKKSARKTTKKAARKSARKSAKRSAKKSATRTGKQAVRKGATGVMAKRAALKARREARQETSDNSRYARKQAKLARTGATAHQAHVGARGRRRQGRRDSR